MSFRGESREARARISGVGVSALLLQRLFARLECGRLVVTTPSGEHVEGRAGLRGPSASLTIHRWRALTRLLTQGHLGFAVGYVEGDWSSPDLPELLEFAARNFTGRATRIAALLPLRALDRLRHLFRGNSRAGSRRNIAFHYDLGNDFYSRWLDAGMTYSSAIYDGVERTLEDAQDVKLRRILDLLDLSEGQDVLEIGCGWGTLAARMAERGARTLGVTLSSQQFSFANALVERRGLQDRVVVQLKDYRDVVGRFDRIASIEMLEAVGEAYWPTYFAALRDRLKPNGKAVLQVITIDESRFAIYRASADFIQTHIFPGGMLPTKTILREQAARAGLVLQAVEAFGPSYARTLAEWRRRFQGSWPELRDMGVSPKFRRLWDYYLCYCEAGFRTGALDVGLYALARAAV